MPSTGSDKAAGGGLSRDPIALKVKVIEALGQSLRNIENEAWDSDLFTPYSSRKKRTLQARSSDVPAPLRLRSPRP